MKNGETNGSMQPRSDEESAYRQRVAELAIAREAEMWLSSPGIDCAFCGHEEVMTAWLPRDIKIRTKEGSRIITTRLPVRRCEACRAQFTDGEAEDVREAVVASNGRRLVRQQIRAVREFLGLSQASIAKFTGFGVATWKRWESGALVPSASSDRMLRMLWRPNGRALVEEVIRELEGIPVEEPTEMASDGELGRFDAEAEVPVLTAAEDRPSTVDRDPAETLRNRFAGSRVKDRFPSLDIDALRPAAESFSLRHALGRRRVLG